MKKIAKSIYFKMFISCSLSILVIELILLVVSVNKKENNLLLEAKEYNESIVTKQYLHKYTKTGIQERITQYKINIFLLTLLITFFVSAVVLACFYLVVGRHIKTLYKLNKETEAGGKVIYLPKDFKIPDSEIGELMRNRDNMLKQLQTSNQNNFHLSKLASLGEMAGGVAHEINNPLMIISGTLSLIKRANRNKSIDNEVLDQYVLKIESTVQRISKIIIGLSTVSRQATDDYFEEISLANMLSSVIGLCSEKMKSTGVQLLLNLDSKEFATSVRGNQVQLSQVFINLISNALDAIEELDEKWIKIDTYELDQFQFITITDSGTGIDQFTQDKIFNPFYTTKEVGKGTGLGLSISKNILMKGGGDLYIDKNSQHTCFIVKVPTFEVDNLVDSEQSSA